VTSLFPRLSNSVTTRAMYGASLSGDCMYAVSPATTAAHAQIQGRKYPADLHLTLLCFRRCQSNSTVAAAD